MIDDSQGISATALMGHSRPDKRSVTQLRTMGCVVGMLSRADGSARFTLGKSSVLCSVYGPTASRPRDEKLDHAHIQVVFSPVSGISGTQERTYEHFIRQVVEAIVLSALHPRTTIQITLQVLFDDGSILSTAINAAVLALIDAGIPLSKTCSAVTCMISKEGVLLLDPVLLECSEAQSMHILVPDATSSEVLAVHSTGLFETDEFDACFELSALAASSIHDFMRAAMERKVQKEQGVDA
ncbi:exosome non-catalytic core subunit rrp46 [Batrachochytrium dendrobatidis]|nr:exosome non-catalytic core subunit rrp46 [Batrachochytrium dendrobatidis]KAK5669958.1 exosome non-catalytic core subunit rrp46 [Batrachochytrium dendrobatidis]